MEIIQDILKNTYQITFKREVAYDWSDIALVLVEQSQPYEFLKEKSLLKNEESQEEVLYWQDLFFMEVAERHNEIDASIIEKIKGHELYKANLKFLNTLPKATLPIGRELLIDQLISVNDDESIIPDHIIGMAVKKKSRDDLKEKFKEWNDEIPETINNDNGKLNTSSKFKYFKYLIAASIVGVIAVIGFNNFNSGYDFDDSQFVQTSNIKVKSNTGIGFAGGEDESSIMIKVFDYNKATGSGNSISDKLVPNSYRFNGKELKLVLEDNNTKTEVIELKQGAFYLKIDKNFYKIENSEKFKNLEELNDQQIIQQLNRILFENE